MAKQGILKLAVYLSTWRANVLLIFMRVKDKISYSLYENYTRITLYKSNTLTLKTLNHIQEFKGSDLSLRRL